MRSFLAMLLIATLLTTIGQSASAEEVATGKPVAKPHRLKCLPLN